MREYQLFLPINIEVLITKDDSVRLLDEILDKLNYKKLMHSYSRLGRWSSVQKKDNLKLDFFHECII